MLDIIIVEDNHEIGELLSDFLRKENYIVSVAKDGEAALELFERYGAKLIILDLMLPGMDGFAVCSKIRETSNAHILIVSAKTEKNDKLKGLNLGADDYIEKALRYGYPACEDSWYLQTQIRTGGIDLRNDPAEYGDTDDLCRRSKG